MTTIETYKLVIYALLIAFFGCAWLFRHQKRRKKRKFNPLKGGVDGVCELSENDWFDISKRLKFPKPPNDDLKKALAFFDKESEILSKKLDNKQTIKSNTMKIKLERYPKNSVLQYEDGWYITFKTPTGNIIKSRGPYKTKAMSEHDRQILNNRQ